MRLGNDIDIADNIAQAGLKTHLQFRFNAPGAECCIAAPL